MKVRGFLSIILYMIGLTLSYTIGNLQLSIVDYWGNTLSVLIWKSRPPSSSAAWTGKLPWE